MSSSPLLCQLVAFAFIGAIIQCKVDQVYDSQLMANWPIVVTSLEIWETLYSPSTPGCCQSTLAVCKRLILGNLQASKNAKLEIIQENRNSANKSKNCKHVYLLHLKSNASTALTLHLARSGGHTLTLNRAKDQ